MDAYETLKLFNIKLIYANRLLKIRNFNNVEKKLILERIDREETQGGVEWVYYRLLMDIDSFLNPVKPTKVIKRCGFEN